MTPERLNAPFLFTPAILLRFACLFFILLLVGCDSDESTNWDDERWQVAVTVEPEHLLVEATIADIHGDYIHMSFRREGHDNGYTVEKSPAPNQEHRDWSRVHHWFGEMYPDTYLEGRIDDGSGEGPADFETFTFRLPYGSTRTRTNFDDENGSEYQYITRGYNYADGNYRHPSFPPGSYHVEIYAWYTGNSSKRHPAIDDKNQVQFVHYEHHLASTVFVIE